MLADTHVLVPLVARREAAISGRVLSPGRSTLRKGRSRRGCERIVEVPHGRDAARGMVRRLWLLE